MLTRAVYWLIQFVLLFCLWLLLVERLAGTEVIVGVIAAALAAIGAEAVRGRETQQ